MNLDFWKSMLLLLACRIYLLCEGWCFKICLFAEGQMISINVDHV